MTRDQEAADRVLAGLRRELDDADACVLAALQRRFELVRAVAQVKAEHGVPVMQPARVDSVVARYTAFAAEHGLGEGAFARLAETVIDIACALEEQLINAEAE